MLEAEPAFGAIAGLFVSASHSPLPDPDVAEADPRPLRSTSPRHGWWRRNAKWLVLGFALGGSLAAGLFYLRNFYVLIASPPYQLALETLAKDPAVRDALGEPIRDTSWFPSGYLQEARDRGEASLMFAIAGPLGAADVSAEARCVGGRWGLNRLVLTPRAGGQRIDVPLRRAQGSGDLPQATTANAPPIEFLPAPPELWIELPDPGQPPPSIADPSPPVPPPSP